MGHVFIAEGDALTRIRMTSVLSDMGHVVTSVATAQEASSMLRKTQLDLLVVDDDLPDLEGYLLLKEYRSWGLAHVPILALGVHYDAPTVEGMLRHGAIDFLPKPFTPAQFATAADVAMEHADELEQRRVELLAAIDDSRSLTPLYLEMRSRHNARSEASAPSVPEDLAFPRVSGARAVDVLVVDDDPSVQFLVSQVVQLLGHTPHVAGDGREALEMARSRRFGLVLLDVMMPRMTGIHFLDELRAMPGGDAIPVVVLTAWHDPERTLKIRDAGALERLPKPFSFEELERSINQALANSPAPANRFHRACRDAEMYADLAALRDEAQAVSAKEPYAFSRSGRRRR